MLAGPVAVRELKISPGERFEILVDFTDRRAVMLETGPDEELGAFGAMAERRIDGEYEPVMRFEPTGALVSLRTCQHASSNLPRPIRRER